VGSGARRELHGDPESFDLFLHSGVCAASGCPQSTTPAVDAGVAFVPGGPALPINRRRRLGRRLLQVKARR
jgi:hypothetical protein